MKFTSRILLVWTLLCLTTALAAIAGDAVIWGTSGFGRFLPSQGFELSTGAGLKQYRNLTVDPSAGAGLAAPVGSIGVRDNGGAGEVWVKIGAANTAWSNALTAGSGWALTGNAGTNPLVNFLGTTDAQDLVFKTNSTEALRLTSAGAIDTTLATGAAYTDATGILLSETNLATSRGGTNHGNFTSGSVIFAGVGGTSLTEDNTNFFWDDTNNTLALRNSVYQFGTADAFARRQIWNYDTNAVLRLGSWGQDGDATNSSSEGIIVYGTSLTGLPISASDGGYARVKKDRFGLFTVDSSLPAYVGGQYYFRTDDVSLYYRDNAGNKTFEVTRASGQIDTSMGAGVVHSDASGILSSSAVSLTADVSGVLPTANGGTNHGNYTAGSIIFAGPGGTSLTEDPGFPLSWDDTNNRFNIGAAGTGKINITNAGGTDLGLNVFSTSSNNAAQIQNQSAYSLSLINAANSATAGASIGGAFSRGTLASRTQSLAGDQLFSLTSQGYTGATFGPGFSGAISFVATENTTATANGGSLVLSTTPNTTLLPVARMTIGQDGVINIPNLTASLPVQTDAFKNLVSVAINLSGPQVTGILPMANGGTNKNMTASNGAVAYSDADSLELTTVGTAGQILQSNGATAPTWVNNTPTLFGSRQTGRSIVAGTGITSGASHMSTTAAKQIVFVVGNGGAPADISASPQIEAGTIVGQEMEVCGTDDTAYVLLEQDNNLAINGPAELTKDRCITLVWRGTDGTNASWGEKGRNF